MKDPTPHPTQDTIPSPPPQFEDSEETGTWSVDLTPDSWSGAAAIEARLWDLGAPELDAD